MLLWWRRVSAVGTTLDSLSLEDLTAYMNHLRRYVKGTEDWRVICGISEADHARALIELVLFEALEAGVQRSELELVLTWAMQSESSVFNLYRRLPDATNR